LKVRWSEDAERDRIEIVEYIWFDNPSAARHMDSIFDVATDRIGRFPFSGREGVISGTRELVAHPSYRLVYQVTDKEIIIHALIHTSRQWPPEPDDDA
jgi:addiction module RelE/StbE family toxin